MYSKGYSVCGGKTHIKEKCWHVIGFPKKHPKYKGGIRGIKEG